MERLMQRTRTKNGEFNWIHLAARDLDAQTAFYEQLFGWTHADLPAEEGSFYRVFLLGDARVAAASQMPPEIEARAVSSAWASFVTVDDVDAAAKSTVDHGGKIIMDPAGPPDGRVAGIEDPTGAMLFVWHGGPDGGAQMFDEPGSLIWNELNTPQPEQAADFYRALLGWQIEKSEMPGPDYWQIGVDGMPEGGIMGMPDQFPAALPSSWLVYFDTSDVGETVRRAEALGSTFQMEPAQVPGSLTFSILADPRGAPFAIMQPLPLS